MTKRKIFVCVRTDGEDFVYGDTISGYLKYKRGRPYIINVKAVNVLNKFWLEYIQRNKEAEYLLEGLYWGWQEVK